MNFIDYDWQNYSWLQMFPDKKNEQIRHLVGTGLYEGCDGPEYCFVPTKLIEKREQEILTLYDKIEVTDSETEICNEIYYTTKIEGAKTTYKRTMEIHNGRPVSHDNYFSEMMVKGGFEATKYLNIHGNRLDENILVEMWNLLIDGCCENEDIRGKKYRIGEVGVGNYMALNSSLVPDAMNEWISFYNSSLLNDYPFIKAALLHVSFERIHPFCDGNGRAGRLLMINYLIGQGYDKCKAISFSSNIAETSVDYYRTLDECNNSYFDCTPFLEYMLSSFDYTFANVLNKIKNPDIMTNEDNEHER